MYWGKPDDKAFRKAICTCTVIGGDGFRLLVDPSLPDRSEMAKELDRRTGLKPDHYTGIEHFQKAAWLATPPIAEILNSRTSFSRKFEPAPGRLFEAIEVLATPGHTRGHHSLRFDCEGRSVVVAGDTVATKDFWRERRSFYNAVDAAMAAKTMEKLAMAAHIVIPGHDNYFTVERP